MFNVSQYFLKLPESMKDLYENRLLRNLAYSMINIFIPIYLLQLGFAFYDVVVFLIIWFLLQGLLFSFVAGLNSIISLRTTMITASIMSIITLFLLMALPDYHRLFYIIPLFLALQASLYWQTFNIDFSRHIDHKQSGKEVGILFSISRLIAVLGPTLGALIIVIFGYNLLLMVVSFLFILSAMPLFGIERRKEPINTQFKILKGVRQYIRPLFTEGFTTTAHTIIWPIFVFMFIQNILSIGYLFSFGYLITAILSIKVGSIIKKGDPSKIMKFGLLFMSLAWLLRFFVNDIFLVYVSQLIFESSLLLFAIPFDRNVYEHAKTTNVSDFIVFREVMFSISRIVMLGLLLFFGFRILFLITAFVSLIPIFRINSK